MQLAIAKDEEVKSIELLSSILDVYTITHFRKHKIEGVDWYCIGVVRKETWEAGENGVDYIAQVYEDTDIDALYQQVLNDAD